MKEYPVITAKVVFFQQKHVLSRVKNCTRAYTGKLSTPNPYTQTTQLPQYRYIGRYRMNNGKEQVAATRINSKNCK